MISRHHSRILADRSSELGDNHIDKDKHHNSAYIFYPDFTESLDLSIFVQT